ncbi:MAG TPA: site-2 protease family protein [Gemmataceae bacterium]|nr:site-2 protease family protein [Gemmataceae bacterium]
MFLLEPGETAYDLKWRMFGVDVRVHPMFWLVSAIMGFSLLSGPHGGVQLFAIWVGCVFVSILIHELGHVCVFRLWGVDAHVVLYAFGGLAVPHRHLYNRWKRIAVSLAGPFAEFLIVALIGVALAAMGLDQLQAGVNKILSIFGIPFRGTTVIGLDPLAEKAVSFLLWINLFWALLNLLPIYPLDGGQVSRDLLDIIKPGGQGVRLALGMSLVLAGLLTVHCIMSEHDKPLIPFLPPLGMYSAMMFAMLGVQSYQMLQHESNPPWRRED